MHCWISLHRCESPSAEVGQLGAKTLWHHCQWLYDLEGVCSLSEPQHPPLGHKSLPPSWSERIETMGPAHQLT